MADPHDNQGSQSYSPVIRPYGESGICIELGVAGGTRLVDATLSAAQAVREKYPHADVVPGIGSLCIFAAEMPDLADIQATLQKLHPTRFKAHHHAVDVVYDGADLASSATALGLTEKALIEAHAADSYTVELVGFLPGFGYLGPLRPELVLPRRSTPRPRVEAGTLAMAAHYTGIYPFASPGGWHLLGRALGVRLFDPNRANPFLFQAGDRVRFNPIPQHEAPPPRRHQKTLDIQLSLRPAGRPYLVVEAAPPLAIVVDAGRRGSLSQGVPGSGPLDPDGFERARRAFSDRPAEEALELAGGVFRCRVYGSPWVSLSGELPFRAEDGARIRVDASKVRYLTLNGGLDVPRVLGSRTTHAVAGFGGFSGRSLRRGDVLFAHAEPDELFQTSPSAQRCDQHIPEPQAEASTDASLPLEIHITKGPHAHLFPDAAWQTLVGSTFRVSPLRSRTGTRLEGPPIVAPTVPPTAPIPMIRGAIQVPPGGGPIVLGPDHPVSGGYPVIAVVRTQSWGKLERAELRNQVRFVLDESEHFRRGAPQL